MKKQGSGKFGTSGGNGGYSKKKAVTDKPNPQKAKGKPYINYKGKRTTGK